MSWSIASSGSQIAFGILATGISIITVWQGHRFWKMWKKHHSQLGVSADLELGLSPSPSPPKDQYLPQTAVYLVPITHERPYPAPVNSRPTISRTGDVTQSWESISPLDLNDREHSAINLVDPFEAYAMIPRIRPNASCSEFGLSPASKPVLSKSPRSLDGIPIATPATEFCSSRHDRIDLPNLG